MVSCAAVPAPSAAPSQPFCPRRRVRNEGGRVGNSGKGDTSVVKVRHSRDPHTCRVAQFSPRVMEFAVAHPVELFFFFFLPSAQGVSMEFASLRSCRGGVLRVSDRSVFGCDGF